MHNCCVFFNNSLMDLLFLSFNISNSRHVRSLWDKTPQWEAVGIRRLLLTCLLSPKQLPHYGCC